MKFQNGQRDQLRTQLKHPSTSNLDSAFRGVGMEDIQLQRAVAVLYIH